MNKQKRGFTLVELIVTITILAILGTIGFISMQSYSKNSRDSVRISDISSIKTSFELFHINAGKYPLTTDGYDVTYGLGKVWTQGIFGESTYKNVSRLDKIPKDPLTEKEYTYSLLNTRQEYELAGIMEGESLALNNTILDKTNAADQTVSVMVTGNYNGETLNVNSLGITCVVAVPSIITSSGTTLEAIVSNNLFVYSNYKNLPSNYGQFTKFKLLGEPNLKLVNESNMELYCGDYSQLNTNESLRLDFIENLQNAYSGTQVEITGRIKAVLELTIDRTNPSPALKIYTIEVVENIFNTTISESQKLSAGECNATYHDESGVCMSDTRTVVITNGTGLQTWNGSSWDPVVLATCETDYYTTGNNTCTAVGIGYYSNLTETTRTACSNNPDTTSRNYTYTSDGNGTNSCTASYTQLCGTDLYETVNGTCTAVGTGNYSSTASNTISSCTTYPDTTSRDYTYTSAGNGTNSCSATYTQLCGTDLYETANGTCTAVGTGYYSANLSNTTTVCTNKPANTAYTGDGNGANNCPYVCVPDGTYTYGACSVTLCGQTGTKPQYDSCGTYVGTVSCSTAACPTSGAYTYGAWGACTATCGGGTQYRTEYCNYDSCYSPQTTSQSCNTQSCCVANIGTSCTLATIGCNRKWRFDTSCGAASTGLWSGTLTWYNVAECSTLAGCNAGYTTYNSIIGWIYSYGTIQCDGTCQ